MSESDQQGDIGVYAVGLKVSKELDWMFRPQPLRDIGIDAHIEVVENDKSKAEILALQIKSGKSWFKETSEQGIVFRKIDSKHLEYWLNYPLPVIIVLHDDRINTAYWQVVGEETVISTGQGWKMIIPFSQKLERASQAALKSLCTVGKNSEFLLAHRAEEIYSEIGNKFGQQGQELVKRLCLSLVRTGVEMKDTCQRQLKVELLALAGDEPEAQKIISKVIEQLIKEGLLVSGGKGSEQEEAWVDLSHEALIKGWKRFAKWREEDRDLRRLVDRVKDAHRDWLGHDKDEQYLMMGGLLTEVRENWKKLEPYLLLSVNNFYQQSYALEEKRHTADTFHKIYLSNNYA
ncbi:MAG: DUF4365 domain-containing protein [Symploca sp. SIO2G7]|nr:DUF4365 domain-containing protein [Symploca sp. SIO2G7]